VMARRSLRRDVRRSHTYGSDVRLRPVDPVRASMFH
jgi:hypothetical protein